MKTNKLLRVTLASLVGILSTAATGLGVWSATQNTLTATENIAFVADKYVDATVEIYVNNVKVDTKTFSEEIDTDEDNNQTAEVNVVYDTANSKNASEWLEDTSTASTIDRKLEVKFVVTNTSSHSNLDMAISGVSAVDNADYTLTIPTTTSYTAVAQDTSKEFIYSYWVSGLADATFTGTWTVTLDAVAKA